jgi:hypothetical protein
MKTSDLTGVALDWAVAKCEKNWAFEPDGCDSYSTDWQLGGPIIERGRIELEHDGFQWWARIRADEDFSGPTPLVAAMRCYVASVLGDEVDVPEELGHT